MKLAGYLLVTFFVLVLWQPVTAACKFYRDGKFETSVGMDKVEKRKAKRFNDLTASRGDLIEVSIEAVFEPMVQGYIIFPSIIEIMERLSNSFVIEDDGTLQIR